VLITASREATLLSHVDLLIISPTSWSGNQSIYQTNINIKGRVTYPAFCIFQQPNGYRSLSILSENAGVPFLA
jgi:hypothetical protein